MMEIKVSDIMSTTVVSIDKDTSVKEAAKILLKNRINSLPVGDSGNVIGIITDYDFVKLTADDKKLKTVAEIMSTNLRIANPNEEIKHAVRLMGKFKVRHLIVKEMGKIVGIISLRDMLKIEPIQSRSTSLGNLTRYLKPYHPKFSRPLNPVLNK